MTDLNEHTDNLCLEEGGHAEQLSIDAQENIKETLLNQARKRAYDASNHEEYHQAVRHYYYDALASFMQEHPDVRIDLILIKLDDYLLN